jgi:hypothetical protein
LIAGQDRNHRGNPLDGICVEPSVGHAFSPNQRPMPTAADTLSLIVVGRVSLLVIRTLRVA